MIIECCSPQSDQEYYIEVCDECEQEPCICGADE